MLSILEFHLKNNQLVLPIFIKAMCHTDVVAPIVTNRFPYFCRTSSFFDSKQSGLLLS